MREAYERAWAAFQVGRYDLCEECILDGLRDDPNDTDLIVLLGHVKLIGGDFAAARALGQNAIERDPDDPRGYSVLAWGTISDATYWPSNPNFVPPTDAAAAGKQRVVTGRRLALRCLELDPLTAGYFGLLAEVEFLCEDNQAALDAANKGLSIDPAHGTSTYARMRALGELRRLDEAIETGLDRLRIEPEDADCHHQLAQLYLQQKDIAASTRHARQAVRLKPNETEHRQTYWDAIKARNPLLRPFVYWQFVAKRLANVPHQWKIIGLIALPAAAGGLAALLAKQFEFEGAWLLVTLGAVVGTFFLASERPCMTLVDLVMFASDTEYRATVDRKELAIATAVTVVAITGMFSFIMAGFWTRTPLVAWFASLVFAAPVVCFLLSDSRWIKAGFVVNIILMAGCLAYSISQYHGSRAGTWERFSSMYGFMAFLFIGLGGATIFFHFKYERTE